MNLFRSLRTQVNCVIDGVQQKPLRFSGYLLVFSESKLIKIYVENQFGAEWWRYPMNVILYPHHQHLCRRNIKTFKRASRIQKITEIVSIFIGETSATIFKKFIWKNTIRKYKKRNYFYRSERPTRRIQLILRPLLL